MVLKDRRGITRSQDTKLVKTKIRQNEANSTETRWEVDRVTSWVIDRVTTRVIDRVTSKAIDRFTGRVIDRVASRVGS
jgi:carbon monoxide dehydrogenase subunit G